MTERWRSPEGARLKAEILSRLLAGKELQDLRLDRHEGRIDLRGLDAPPVRQGPEIGAYENLVAYRLEGVLRFGGATLEGLDLSQAALASARFMGARIVDCRFDGASCRDWRLWKTDMIRTTFTRADLRESVLGSWHEGRGDRYEQVDLSGADLRGAVLHGSSFVDVDFSNARLNKVEFDGCDLVRCRFAGLLREVTFHRRGFRLDWDARFEDVDMSGARFEWVDFRQIDPGLAKLPQDDDLIILHNFPCVLQRALERIADDDSMAARGLRGLVKHWLKWLAPGQVIGVVSRHDLRDGVSPGEADFALDVLRRAEAECMSN